MVIQRGDIWWASLPEPSGSESGYRRPVLVIQSDAFNRSRIDTVFVAAILATKFSHNLPLGEIYGKVD